MTAREQPHLDKDDKSVQITLNAQYLLVISPSFILVKSWHLSLSIFS